MIPTAFSLRQVMPDAQFFGCDYIRFAQVQADSRRIVPGDVFVAIRGTRHNGHLHIRDAISRGAQAVIAEDFVEDIEVSQALVNCSATAFAKLSMLQHAGSSHGITMAGITGTNGKTTTSYMVRSILQAAQLRTGIVGTIETSDVNNSVPSEMTTPSSEFLAQHTKVMMACGTSHCVLEVSSHALDQKRCAALRFAVAAITNITHDHLDYHETIAKYSSAKASIAKLLHPDAPLLINVDDSGCNSILDQLSGVPLVTYGIENNDAELRATILTKTHRSQRICLHLAQGDAEVRLRLIGHHNVSNALAAAGIAEQLGIRLKDIVAGLEALSCVPGRLERIDEGQPFQLLIDYAHTPDALQRSITTIRDFVPGKLICVFGAGGNRDVSKRPAMGAVASAADLCIVTSDNPRDEEPNKIMCEVAAGFCKHTHFEFEVDREHAILRAFRCAEPGDVVLLAGKGHEGTQEIAGRKLAFDDRDVARRLLRFYGGNSAADLQPVFSLPRSA